MFICCKLLQRISSNTLICFSFCLLVQASGAFTVNSALDLSDATPGDGIAAASGGLTTLRAAVEESNALFGADTIDFDLNALRQEPVLTVGATIEISDALTITGPGASLLSISGDSQFRIFFVDADIELNISDVTIRDGYVDITDNLLFGAGIYAEEATVNLEDCVFTSNRSSYNGCGVYLKNGTLSVERCTFVENEYIDAGAGGGISVEFADLVVANSLFENNVAQAGAGIATNLGTATIRNCLFRDNEGIGGGIYALETDISVFDSLFQGNQTTGAGGGLSVTRGTATVVNCTFSGNIASGAGGAIYLNRTDATVMNSTISENAGNQGDNTSSGGGGIHGRVLSGNGVFRIGNSVISNNSAKQELGPDVYGPFISLGGNFVGKTDESTGFTEPSDQTGTVSAPIDAELGPLCTLANGTPGYLPSGQSPLLNAALNTLVASPPFEGAPFHDARGDAFARIVGTAVDIGALELQIGESSPCGLIEIQSADQDSDSIISLSELLRVIQFYNSLGLHCADSPTDTEDGYLPGPGGNQTCTPYDTDYNPQDWAISLTELLRVIQFYNSGGYNYCPASGSEDGFCAGIA